MACPPQQHLPHQPFGIFVNTIIGKHIFSEGPTSMGHVGLRFDHGSLTSPGIPKGGSSVC